MTSENRTRVCEWIIPAEELLKALQVTGRLPKDLKVSTRTPGEPSRFDEVEFAVSADGMSRYGPQVRGPVIACWTERDPRLSDQQGAASEREHSTHLEVREFGVVKPFVDVEDFELKVVVKESDLAARRSSTPYELVKRSLQVRCPESGRDLSVWVRVIVDPEEGE